MALSACKNQIDEQKKELVEHGSVEFPIACYYDDLGYEDVDWHWHDELEAVVVSEGKCIVAAGTEKFEVKEGEGFFINANVLHGAWDTENAGCHFHSLVFHPRLVGGSVDSIFWQKYVQPLLTNQALKYVHFDLKEKWHQKAVEAIEKAWQEAVYENPGFEFRMRDALSQFIFELSVLQKNSLQKPSEKVLRDGERIKRMLQFIAENYDADIDTRMIAGSASVSESECLRCFRKMIGKPPIQYVRQFRIQKAAELLIHTDLKIAEIGALCGFQDTSYFTKTFREMKDCTPGEFRHTKA